MVPVGFLCKILRREQILTCILIFLFINFFFVCVMRFIPLKIILALFCELLLLDVELYQLANLGWISRHAVLQQRSNAKTADLDVCVRYHSRTYSFSVTRIIFGSSFYRPLFPPSLPIFCISAD